MKECELAIHVHPDLDACACVALSGISVRRVHFWPAGLEQVPTHCPCCGKYVRSARVLDHPLGEKGQLDADGTRHGAATSMPEAASAHPDLIAEVEEQETTGDAVPRFSLASITNAIRREASERGVRGIELDRAVLEAMVPILRGLNLVWTDRLEMEAVADRLQTVTVAGHRIAVLPTGHNSPQLGVVLAERGIAGGIFAEGNCLGVTRYPGFSEPDLRQLEGHLPGWFIHSAGFLACWGTRKNPVAVPPPAGTPQTQAELVALLRWVYNS